MEQHAYITACFQYKPWNHPTEPQYLPHKDGVLALVALYIASPLVLGRIADNPAPASGIQRPSVPVLEADHKSRIDVHGTPLPPLDTVYYFDQLVDHKNPQLGSFKQRYWMSWEFYQTGRCGPVVLFTPGEANAASFTGYLTNTTITGAIAQQQHGAAIVLEHRFFGLSNPYPYLNATSLQFHTIQQAIDDLERFAKTANLPMPGGGAVKPNQVPWVLVGGSYSGALTSWTMVAKPNLFAAGYASSAVVQAIPNFWAYMPQNCSNDVQAVIAHIDQVFTSGSQPEINSIKANFGLQTLTHLDDVAGALRFNLFDWQSLSPNTGTEGRFFKFCDPLEVNNGATAPASGFGLNHALTAWGNFWRTSYLTTLCGSSAVSVCLGTYDPSLPYYRDTRVDNANRSWLWLVCNELGFYQVGAPAGHPTLVTRLINPEYRERLCTYFFPAKFSTPPVPSADAVNRAYAGWNVNIDHLFFANARRDPWLEATVSAGSSPYMSSAARPVGLSDGFHCSDLITAAGYADATVEAVQRQGMAAIKTWIAAFRPTVENDIGKKVRFEKE